MKMSERNVAQWISTLEQKVRQYEKQAAETLVALGNRIAYARHEIDRQGGEPMALPGFLEIYLRYEKERQEFEATRDELVAFRRMCE